MDLRLELVSVTVADVDRAKAFHVDQVGFGVEQDVQIDENHRFVELMPPGSPCPKFACGSLLRLGRSWRTQIQTDHLTCRSARRPTPGFSQ